MESGDILPQDTHADAASDSKTGPETESETGSEIDDAPWDGEGAESLEALKRDWGDDFDANIGYARDAAERFADEALVALLEETGLGDDPRIVRAAAEIGRQLAGIDREPVAPGGDGKAPTGIPETGTAALNAELDRLIASPDYWTARGQRRARELFVRLNGEGALPIHRRPGDAGSALDRP